MELTVEQFFAAIEDNTPETMIFAKSLDELDSELMQGDKRNLKKIAKDILFLIDDNRLLTYTTLCDIFNCKQKDLASCVHSTQHYLEDKGYKLVGDRYFECYNVKEI